MEEGARRAAAERAEGAVLSEISRAPFRLAAALLVGAAVLLYSGTYGNPFVFDDLAVFGGERSSPLRWLPEASFSLVLAAFGAEPLPQRIVNALLHGATGVALFGFLARLFAVVLAEARSRWLAFFAALWFVVHPVAVYGVAYLMQRSIILATLFSVVALWCVLEGLERGRARWYAAAGAAYLLALVSKEHAVMLPAVAVALAVVVRGASAALLRRAMLGLGLCLAAAAAVLAQRLTLVGTAYEPNAAGLITRLGADAALVYPLSVENQATLFWRYLGTWLVPWPGWMSIDVRTSFPRELAGLHTLGFILWLAYPVAACWLLVQRGRAALLGFGLLYPWLLALTEVAAVRVQEPFVLYRSYLWMSGLPAILPAVVAPLAPRWRLVSAGVLCALLGALALGRLESFSSPLALWDDAVRKNHDLAAPYVERPYVARGLAHLDERSFDAAGADFERALRLNPSSPEAYVGRGLLKLRSGRAREALEDMDRALALDPEHVPGYYNRCAVNAALGQYAQALGDCDKALALVPLNTEAWVNRGVVYAALGRPAEAAANFERALQLHPSHGPAHFNYGTLLAKSGRFGEARLHFAAACEAGIEAACGR
ncbi:MAG TPA: tetratricopeptide repeat protein [Burkholderiales bacterium]